MVPLLKEIFCSYLGAVKLSLIAIHKISLGKLSLETTHTGPVSGSAIKLEYTA